jgi:uncharacterized membrane protein YdjX (TVP38/TMEM64 family)
MKDNADAFRRASAGRAKRSWGIAALGCLAILGIVALIWLWHRQPEQILTDLSNHRAQLHAYILQNTLLASIAFIAAYAALMLLICIPSWPCTVIGGFLFGAVLGSGGIPSHAIA